MSKLPPRNNKVLPVCLGLGLSRIMVCDAIQVAGEGGVISSGCALEIVVTTSVVGAASKWVKKLMKTILWQRIKLQSISSWDALALKILSQNAGDQ